MNQRIGRPAEALAAFAAAHEAGDADAEVFAGMGVAQRRLGPDGGRVLPAASAGARARPRRGAARARGDLHRKANQPAEAVGLLTRALALEPERAEPGARWLARCARPEIRPERSPCCRPGRPGDAGSAASLGAAASIHREQGDLPGRARRAAAGGRPRSPRSSRCAPISPPCRGAGRRRRCACRRRQLAQVLEDAPPAAGAKRTAQRTSASIPWWRALPSRFPTRASGASRCSACARPATWRRLALATGSSPVCRTSPALEAALERDVSATLHAREDPRRRSPALGRRARPHLYAFENERLHLGVGDRERGLGGRRGWGLRRAAGARSRSRRESGRRRSRAARTRGIWSSRSACSPAASRRWRRSWSTSSVSPVGSTAHGVWNPRALLAYAALVAAAALPRAAGLGHDRGADQAPAEHQGLPPHPHRHQAGEGAGRGGAEAAAQRGPGRLARSLELVLPLREAHGRARDGLPLDPRAQARLRRHRARSAAGRHAAARHRPLPRGAARARAARTDREGSSTTSARTNARSRSSRCGTDEPARGARVAVRGDLEVPALCARRQRLPLPAARTARDARRARRSRLRAPARDRRRQEGRSGSTVDLGDEQRPRLPGLPGGRGSVPAGRSRRRRGPARGGRGRRDRGAAARRAPPGARRPPTRGERVRGGGPARGSRRDARFGIGFPRIGRPVRAGRELRTRGRDLPRRRRPAGRGALLRVRLRLRLRARVLRRGRRRPIG